MCIVDCMYAENTQKHLTFIRNFAVRSRITKLLQDYFRVCCYYLLIYHNFP